MPVCDTDNAMLRARSAVVPRTLAIRFALAAVGSGLLAVSAHVAVPMLPVPITLQTLALPLLVLALGRNLAVMATLLYLAEGAFGWPVFAPVAGPPGLVGPTAGYLWMYPVAAFTMGALLDRGLTTTYAGRWAAIFAGTVLVFAGGVWWLTVVYQLNFGQAFAVGVAPFIIGDFLKVSLAAALPSQAAKIAARFHLP
ncbi:MAG TPA: biotin transporter BioY [Candidatus Lustribacter sp.]